MRNQPFCAAEVAREVSAAAIGEATVIELNQVEALIAVHVSGGIPKAARDLKLHRTTLDKRIRDLERKTGLTLVNRWRGRDEDVLTKEGLLLLPFAVQLMAASSRFHRAGKAINLDLSSARRGV